MILADNNQTLSNMVTGVAAAVSDVAATLAAIKKAIGELWGDMVMAIPLSLIPLS
jgi:hypothetical protein